MQHDNSEKEGEGKIEVGDEMGRKRRGSRIAPA